MVMSIKEATALIREAQSREELAKAMKAGGKDYEKQRLALEKALGGQKKLAQVDALLAKAERTAEKAVVDARGLAVNIVNDAKAYAARLMDEVERKEANLLARSETVAKAHKFLDKQRALNDAQENRMGDKDIIANDREMALNTREANVTMREAKATEREAETAKFEAWRASAPNA